MDPKAEAIAQAAQFVETLNNVLIYPIIALLSAVAFLVFLWGCSQYIMNAGNDKARQDGIRHITWGIVGLVVMLSAWGILQVFTATFGLDDELDCANNPTAGGCVSKFSVPQS